MNFSIPKKALCARDVSRIGFQQKRESESEPIRTDPNPNNLKPNPIQPDPNPNGY